MKNATASVAKIIVVLTISELNSKKGFDGWWGNMDNETKNEIKEALIGKTKEVLDTLT